MANRWAKGEKVPFHHQRLRTQVKLAPTPTPRAIDGRAKGNGPRPDTLTGLMTYDENKVRRAVSGPTPNGCSAETARPVHLNPEHARWLMGLPSIWMHHAPTCAPTETP